MRAPVRARPGTAAPVRAGGFRWLLSLWILMMPIKLIVLRDHNLLFLLFVEGNHGLFI
jgi:hypothetical protein